MDRYTLGAYLEARHGAEVAGVGKGRGGQKKGGLVFLSGWEGTATWGALEHIRVSFQV